MEGNEGRANKSEPKYEEMKEGLMAENGEEGGLEGRFSIKRGDEASHWN